MPHTTPSGGFLALCRLVDRQRPTTLPWSGSITARTTPPRCDRRATGRGCSLSTTSVDRRGPPSTPLFTGTGRASGKEKSRFLEFRQPAMPAKLFVPVRLTTKTEPTLSDSLVLDKTRYQRNAVVRALAAQLGLSPCPRDWNRTRSAATWVIDTARRSGSALVDLQAIAAYRFPASISYRSGGWSSIRTRTGSWGRPRHPKRAEYSPAGRTGSSVVSGETSGSSNGRP